MPKRKRKSETGAEPAPTLEKSFARIANLLAALLVKGESESQKVITLASVGFTPGEIAHLLNKQPNTVSVILYQAKRSKK